MSRRTVVVEGPLASGVQIMTLPQVAARLGFIRPARSQDLEPAIRTALEMDGFVELESIRQLPGMTRSIALALTRVWDADLALADRAGDNARLQDLASIEARVRANLPQGVLTPRDLRDAALQRLANAPAVLGAIEFDRVTRMAPVWRPLIETLTQTARVTWRNPGVSDLGWFSGAIETDVRPASAFVEIVSCANPRAEVAEALRWMRELISLRPRAARRDRHLRHGDAGLGRTHDDVDARDDPSVWQSGIV